jgi:hypothetical protein
VSPYRCLKVPSSRVPCGRVLAPTRICTLERGQALTHGSRPPEARAVAAGEHGISTAAGHIVEHLPHGELVQTRISKCGGSSDDIALTSRTRGWLSDGACVHLLRRVLSHRSSGLLVPQCQGSRFVARGGRARSGACMHTAVARARHSRVSLPNCPWEQSFEKKNLGLSETSLMCRDKSCILECKHRVQVEVRVYRISEVYKPPVPVRHRSPTRLQTVRGHRHSRTSASRWSKIGRVDHPRQYVCKHRCERNRKVGKPPAPVRHRSPTRSQPVRGHRHSRTSASRWSKIGRAARPRQYACNDRGGRNPEVR